jgi:hypothetical protein|tara:strand:+ start:362 stop:550 length:189 start_codon:yes stop_codon:yes gene_type:complete
MSLTKNYYWDQAEKAVDKIIVNLKNNLITESTAIKEILDVEAVALLDIDAYNVEEFIESELA